MDIVFLPGLNNTGDVFRDVAAALPPQTRSHCPDLPPLDSVEALADAVLANAPPSFVLAGYSFGGYVAMAVLEKARDRLNGLCLMGSSARADSEEQKAKRQQTLQAFDSATYVDTASSSLAPFHPDNRARPDLVARRRALASAYGAQRYVAHVRATMDRKDRSHLLDGAVPTLWLAGSHDAVVPVQRQAEEAAKARHCEWVEISGAGHLLPLEQPSAVALALSTWMGRLR
ncbi:alpha/beta fold hydrolase [Hydrogenophaga sp. BPS33]|uniref:alpha/beta fold hydrolase n=1 Tax=Hydrogenophaga sp. BPS33 TaxID=2651974 RepID=UPI00131F65F8|nr:alpha/beta hydrolase [Hydrogenophaga sp. BPS33]QHE84286.1 alpha/beta hydrolase [Hydrogenophaga sp. BPS33]